MIDVLTKGLTKTIADATVAQPVRVAAARGYQVVNKYYSLTDDSIMYRAAMSKFESPISMDMMYVLQYRILI